MNGVNLSSRSAFVQNETTTHDPAPQGIILLSFLFPPPPCLLFLLVPATPLRQDSIDPGFIWGGDLDPCSAVRTDIQKGGRGLLLVLQGGVRRGVDRMVVCAVVSSASFGTASTFFPLSCSTVSSLPF